MEVYDIYNFILFLARSNNTFTVTNTFECHLSAKTFFWIYIPSLPYRFKMVVNMLGPIRRKHSLNSGGGVRIWVFKYKRKSIQPPPPSLLLANRSPGLGCLLGTHFQFLGILGIYFFLESNKERKIQLANLGGKVHRGFLRHKKSQVTQ